jgi:hypothetical protein
MDCEDCDKNNVVRSYCYFSRRKEYFKEITGQELTFESFAVFATELQLAWRIPVCPLVPRTELVMYWKCLEPLLLIALHNRLCAEQVVSNFYIDWNI